MNSRGMLVSDRKIYCVVVTFNGEEWIRRCLSSLASSSVKVSVVVVDNGSSDKTCDIIRSDFSQYELIASPENLGFGRGNNAGIQVAIARGAEFVFLLNQDAWVDTNTIEKLVDVSQRNPRYGILSPLHLQNGSGRLDSLFALHIIPPKCELYYDLNVMQKKIVYDCGFVNAAAWLLTRKCISEVGMFEPMFFLYGEDLNYVQRVKFHGYSVGIVPATSAVHDRAIRKGQKSPKGLAIERETFLYLKLLDVNVSFTKRLKGALKLFVKYGINFITIRLFLATSLRLRKMNGIVRTYKKKSDLMS